MVSISAPMRPYGAPQLHTARVLRSGPGFEPFVTVEGVDGVPLSIVTRFLAGHRKLSVSRLNKMAWTIANVLDLLKARRVELLDSILTGDGLWDHHVIDIIAALQFVGPRTAAIRGADAESGRSTALHVGDVEWMNRVDIAKKFIVFVLKLSLRELRRDALQHAHARDVIADVEQQFVEEMISAASDPRKGLEPAELKFLDEVIHPAHPLNPWGVDRQMLFVILVLYRLLGHRAREVLLYQVTDLVDREGGAALRLLPTDLRYDRSGMPVSLKKSPRYLRIPPWCADLLQDLIDNHRPLIGERLKARGNFQGLARFKECPYIFVSARGGRLSSTVLYDRLRLLRETFPDKLPADLSPGRLRNSRADELVKAARESGLDLSRVAQNMFGWEPHSIMLDRYANMEAERATDAWLRSQANMVEALPS
ncbi:hypothetical protein QA649_37460 [Bradyrhizobium sp. CB1717]|uniref:hypothetical protein n=1 Tax=Bradyrhizobium sp. CB1717 TaxID=3039154 RepID=UPI0024B21DC9|nr:hypothetical protein [Bradyrhizobium sp. CB1717]WFU23641.1 hypothetical protein QA649_37460 [Bradyrhizobium sp. CB1717]